MEEDHEAHSLSVRRPEPARQPPLDLILVGSPENGYYRATFAPTLFFSYNQTPG